MSPDLDRRPVVPGVTLIALGVVLLLMNAADVPARLLWPAVLLAPGIAMFVAYATHRTRHGILMPATILTLYGCLFFYCAYEGWEAMNFLWPVFLLAPGLGFLLLYALGPRVWGFLVPGLVLTGMAVIFLLGPLESDYALPIVLILLGALFLLRGLRPGPSGPRDGRPEATAPPAAPEPPAHP